MNACKQLRGEVEEKCNSQFLHHMKKSVTFSNYSHALWMNQHLRKGWEREAENRRESFPPSLSVLLVLQLILQLMEPPYAFILSVGPPCSNTHIHKRWRGGVSACQRKWWMKVCQWANSEGDSDQWRPLTCHSHPTKNRQITRASTCRPKVQMDSDIRHLKYW